MTEEQRAALKGRLEEAENPGWYLDVFGMSLEDSGGDVEQSLLTTDEVYARQPEPPLTDEQEEERDFLDALSGDSVLLDMDADINAAPLTAPQSIINLHVHQAGAPETSRQPINITNVLPEAPPASVIVNVPEQPAPNVVVKPPMVKITNVVEPAKVEVIVPEPKPMEKTARKGADGKWTIKEKPAE
mgnify:CR=1 FL=1